MHTNRKTYALMTTGAAIGVIAAFLQTLEKLELLKNKDAILPCNINSVFSCSTVLNAPQSSVFGFPNSIMCMGLFVIFFAISLVGLTSGKMARGLRLSIQALSFFTLCFALWFLWQSTYVIGALCIFCIFCFIGLLLVNGAWLRVNATDLPISNNAKAWLMFLIRKKYDILIWLVLGLVVAAAMMLRFSS